jgi:hypothetical protein
MKYYSRINNKPLPLTLDPLHSMHIAPNHPTATILASENLNFLNHLVSTVTPHPILVSPTFHSPLDTILPSLPDISPHLHLLHHVLLLRTLFPNPPLLDANTLPARYAEELATVRWTATIAWILHTKGAIPQCSSLP